MIANKVYIGGQKYKWVDQFAQHQLTKEIINYANANGYTLPTNLDAYDYLIKGLDALGLIDNADRIFLSAVPGADMNFRSINIANPGNGNRIFYGGVSINSYGGTQYTTNGYSDLNTNWAPFGTSGAKLSSNDIGAFFVKTITATYALYSGRSGVSYMLNAHGNTTNSNRIINSTNMSFDYTGAGTMGITRNSPTSVEFYNKDVRDARVLVGSANITSWNQAYYARGGFNQSNYNTIDDLIIYVGKYYDESTFQAFRILFNNYLTMVGLTPIA